MTKHKNKPKKTKRQSSGLPITESATVKRVNHLRVRTPSWLKTRAGFIGVMVIVLIILAAGAVSAYATHYDGKVYPNTYIGTQNYGGQTEKEAKATLVHLIDALPPTIQISISDKPTEEIKPKDIGLTFSVDETAHDLIGTNRDRNWIKQAYRLVRARLYRTHVAAHYALDDAKTSKAIQAIVDKSTSPAVDAKIILKDDNTLAVEPAKEGHGLHNEEIKTALLENLSVINYHLSLTPGVLKPRITEHDTAIALEQVKAILAKTPVTFVAGETKVSADSKQVFSWISYENKLPESPKTSFIPLFFPHSRSWPSQAKAATTSPSPLLVAHINPEEVKKFLLPVAQSVTHDYTNAEIRMVNNQLTVVQNEVNGQKLSLDQAVTTTAKQLESNEITPNLTITLPVETVEPPIKASTISTLGIKELIGTAMTDFKGSPTNRVHNITTGANFLNGELLAPNQEFSTIKTLGKIDDSTGYLPELVIKEDRTTPEYGGGLCQVSTTLFRAVMNSGLKITARQNHSYRVSYYEPPVGLDATIYMPQPDFRFYNDTPGYILIQNRVEGTKITFELYGTKDGRSATVSDPVVSDITDPPAPIYTDTDTLPKGTTKQVEKQHQGATASATYTVTRDGKEIIHQVFRSKYKPWPARFLVGTKDPNAPAPSPSPSPAP